MQRAHGRHQTDRAVLFAAQFPRQRHHALASIYDFHKRWSLDSDRLAH